MKLFGGKLPVISVAELISYASRSKVRIKLELCECKELSKLVVRVAKLGRGGKELQLGVLVDTSSADYFVTARSISSIRGKLERLLIPILSKLQIVFLENSVLQIFQGGAITKTKHAGITQ